MPVLVNPSRFGTAPPPSGITLAATGTIVERATGAVNVDIPYPPALAAGDIIVMFVRAAPNAGGQTGWTQIASINNSNTAPLWVGYKIATGSESGSYTFLTVGSTSAMGQMLAFRGVDQTTPIDVTATTSNTQGTSSTSTPIPSLTTTKTGVALIYAGGDNSSANTATAPTSPTGFTETADHTVSGAPSGTFGYLIWSGSGATGIVTIGWSGAARSTGVLMALRPA